MTEPSPMPSSALHLGDAIMLVMAVMLVMLTGCETVATDTGLACVVPEGSGCQDRLQNDISELSEHEDFNATLEDCEPGSVEAGTPIVIRVFLGHDPGVSNDLECSAEISGDFEVTITSSFRWREERSESGARGLWVECETPALASGDWTFRYGDSGIAYVPVPSPEAPIFCLNSGTWP